MFTRREKKMMDNILTGKMNKFRFFSTIFLLIFFLSYGTFIFMQKIKTENFYNQMYEKTNLALLKIETQTQKEAFLKSLLIENSRDLLEQGKTLALVTIYYKGYMIIFFLVPVVLFLWSVVPFERIIKKLSEDKSIKEPKE